MCKVWALLRLFLHCPPLLSIQLSSTYKHALEIHWQCANSGSLSLSAACVQDLRVLLLNLHLP